MGETLINVLSYIVLATGLVYAAVELKASFRGGKLSGEGSFAGMAAAEAAVFFFASMGFSDFLLQLPIFKRTGWVEDRCIPSTMFSASVVPGSAIAFFYLRNVEGVDPLTLIVCMIAMGSGCALGSRVMLNTDGHLIRKIMFFALFFSMAALIVKLVVSNGASGTETGLKGVRLAVSAGVIFVLGFINAFGIPMKPSAAALLLVMGLSPLAALTVILLLGVVGPSTANVSILKKGDYHKRITAAAVIFGTAGALPGCLLALKMDQLLLTILLILVIAVTIITWNRK